MGGWPQRTAVTAVVLVATVSLTGCGGKGTPRGSNPPSKTQPTSKPAAQSPREAAQQIKVAFTTFFAGSTPPGKKIALVQQGGSFATVIHKQAGSPIAKGTSVKVGNVHVDTKDSATVRYTILLGGHPALTNQTGKAVREQGRWKVSAGTFCTLLSLEQSAPASCKSQ